MYCKNCGYEYDGNPMFCPNCGTRIQGEIQESENSNSKVLAIVGYITWIGFIVSMVMKDSNDEFVMFHLNQALVLNVFSIIACVVMIIPIIGWIAGIVGEILILIAWIMGLVGACTDQMNETFLFGKIHWLN